MRRVEDNWAENFIKKHRIHKMWVVFALCVTLLTGSSTLYMLNKPATAMTEDGASSVGLVLETADAEFEQGLIRKMEEDEEEEKQAEEEKAEEEQVEEQSEKDKSEAVQSEEVKSEEKKVAEELSEEKKAAEELSEEKKVAEELSEGKQTGEHGNDASDNRDDASKTGSVSSDSEDDEKIEEKKTDKGKEKQPEVKDTEKGQSDEKKISDDKKIGEDKKSENLKNEAKKDSVEKSKEASDEIVLERDVVLTATYVDTKGESIADEKEMRISESFDPAMEASEVEGYIFKEAAIGGETFTLLTAVTDEETGYKYFKAALEDETKDIKEDATVVLTYRAENEEEVLKKESEEAEEVILTARYVDGYGDEIRDSEELKITEETELTDAEELEIEGYFFDSVTIDDTKIVKIAPVIADDETEEIDSLADSEKDSSADSEKDNTVDSEKDSTTVSEKVSTTSTESDSKVEELNYKSGKEESAHDEKTLAYIATTSDGNEIEITEDADIVFRYLAVNTKEEFEFKNDKYKVKVKLSKPEVLPEGVSLKVTPLDTETEGYNYEAYIDALNDNAEEIAKKLGQEEGTKHDENNTILLDIAFVLEDIEYEPSEGNISVSIEFEKKQISEGLQVADPEAVAIIHLPVAEKVMEEIDKTSEATDITSSDIKVDVLTSSKVELGEESDSIEFETESFSVFAMTKNVVDLGATWKGPGLTDNTAGAIVNSLGKAVYFGVVADYFYSSTTHFETNVAATRLGEIPSETLFDYDAHYIYTSEYKNYKINVTKRATQPGIFEFGAFSDKDGTDLLRKFSIDASSFDGGWYVGSTTLSGVTNSSGSVYIYELDGDKVCRDGEACGNYTITYSGNFVNTSDATDALMSSYITEWNGSESTLKYYLHPNSTLYYSTGSDADSYVKVRKDEDSEVINGSLPVKAADLLADARGVSKALPYAASAGDVEVLNIKATTGTFMDDLYAAAKDRYGWTDRNHVTNRDMGIRFDESKLLVINLDLSKYDQYTMTEFFVNGHSSEEDFIDLDSRVIINPVKLVDNEYVPYDGELTVKLGMGTILAPSASVIDEEVNGTIIARSFHHSTGEIHKTSLIRFLDIQGDLTITGSYAAGNVDILLHKLVNEQDPGTKEFSFTIKRLKDDMTGWSNGKLPEGQDHTSLKNVGKDIRFSINPEYWSMTSGKTYIFRIEEDDLDTYNKEYKIDKSKIYVKVEYKNDGNSVVTYYLHSQTDPEFDFWNNNYSDAFKKKDSGYIKMALVDGLCADSKKVVTGDDVAFKNQTVKLISVSVVKEWDDLIGKNKKSPSWDTKLVPDCIFDVTVKLLYSADNGISWQMVENGEYTFNTPRVGQRSQGANFEGTMGDDYEEPWTGRSKPHEFTNLNPDYLYKVQEWYGSQCLGEYSADGGVVSLNNKTVNGYKLESVNVERLNGDITFTLHNTPYLQIQKYWKVAGSNDIVDHASTEGFNPVYVKLFRSYQDDNTPIDVTSEVSGNNVIELNYAGGWFAEFPVPRKMDDSVDGKNVRQCVYTIVECTLDGTLLPESSAIEYGSVRHGNTTRDSSIQSDMKGFHSKTTGPFTKHHGAWVQGNNYPEIILTVTNIRGTNVLPETGGSGTAQFAALGVLLMSIAFAGFMLIKNRESL
ncbi:MAG: LPXTG cell wall anchor domain-containing protein [Butyrivibrio sp.]|nr:LPXTG cell wall anchor domain-containing protein [Butyrivibrio sp.]